MVRGFLGEPVKEQIFTFVVECSSIMFNTEKSRIVVKRCYLERGKKTSEETKLKKAASGQRDRSSGSSICNLLRKLAVFGLERESPSRVLGP